MRNLYNSVEKHKGRLAGKVAIIAGAASALPGLGIGKATAIEFANQGAKVLLVNRDAQSVQQLRDEIINDGGDCDVFIGDLSNKNDVEKMVDKACRVFGKIDILFQNAGQGAPGTVVDVLPDVWENAINNNLNTAMLTSRFCIPKMIESGGGSIITVSTVGAVQGFSREGSGFAAYAASKAGLIGLTRSIAADFAKDQIRANSLIVGMVNTPALQKFGEDAREKRRLAIPLKIEGSALDVAAAAVFLASDESRWITGISLPVDGGQMNLHEFPG